MFNRAKFAGKNAKPVTGAVRRRQRDVAAMAQEDVLELVRSLEARQAELEHQNDELRRSREELAQSRHRYLQLFDSAPVGYVTLNSQGVILEANTAAATLLGVRREELVRRKLSRFLQRASQAAFRSHREAVFSAGARQNCEVRFKRPEGGDVAVLMESVAAAGTGREARCCHTALIDISARKRVEASLSESELRYRTLAEASTDMIYVIGADHRVAYVNRCGTRWVGCPPKDLVGQPLARLFPAAVARRHAQHVQAVLAQGQPLYAEEETPLPGHTVWLGTWFVPLKDAAGRVGAVMGVSRDITSLKQLEQALTLFGESLEQRVVEETAELSRREQKFHALADNVPALFSYIGPDLRYRYVNRCFEKLFGRSAAEMVGRRMKEVIGKGNYSIDRPYLDRALAGEQVSYEAEFLLPDGPRSLAVTYMPDFGPDRKVQGVFSLVHDVTERKQAERALRESQDDLNRAQALAQVGSWRMDAGSNEMQWSEEACRMLGIPAGTRMTPGAFLELVHPDDRGMVDAAWQAALRGEPYALEHRLVVQAQVKWVREVMEPEFDPDGRLLAGLGTIQDMTARRRTEEQLRLQAAALEAAANGIALTDRAGIMQWVNPAFVKMTGYPSEEVVGRSPVVAKSSEHDAEFHRELWATILGGKVWQGQLVNRRKDGSRYWDEMTITPVPDPGGAIGHFIAIKQDVTARKAAEQALRESEERFRLMVNTVSEYAIYLLDGEGRVVSWNVGAERMTGYQSRDILGRYVSVFYPPEDVAAGRPGRELDDALAAGRTEMEQWRVRKDGSRYWANVTTTALRDEQGRLRGFARIIRDLTERRRLETAVSSAAEAEKNRIASDLHDGLSPQLSGLGLLAEGLRLDLAAAQPELAQRAARIGEILRETAVQTRGLVRGLYSVAAGPEGLKVALNNLAERTQQDSGIRCQFRCPEPVLVADTVMSTHLYRMAQEAVHNALKHSGAARIQIDLRQSGQSVELAVRDNGTGFAAKPNGGLGLQTLRHRAAIIGGELTIRNLPKGGAEVLCTVPLAPQEPTPRP